MQLAQTLILTVLLATTKSVQVPSNYLSSPILGYYGENPATQSSYVVYMPAYCTSQGWSLSAVMGTAFNLQVSTSTLFLGSYTLSYRGNSYNLNGPTATINNIPYDSLDLTFTITWFDTTAGFFSYASTQDVQFVITSVNGSGTFLADFVFTMQTSSLALNSVGFTSTNGYASTCMYMYISSNQLKLPSNSFNLMFTSNVFAGQLTGQNVNVYAGFSTGPCSVNWNGVVTDYAVCTQTSTSLTVGNFTQSSSYFQGSTYLQVCNLAYPISNVSGSYRIKLYFVKSGVSISYGSKVVTQATSFNFAVSNVQQTSTTPGQPFVLQAVLSTSAPASTFSENMYFAFTFPSALCSYISNPYVTYTNYQNNQQYVGYASVLSAPCQYQITFNAVNTNMVNLGTFKISGFNVPSVTGSYNLGLQLKLTDWVSNSGTIPFSIV
jgi:hypothetical protein